MQLFYGTEINGDVIILDEQESSHCVRVMRMKMGDAIDITDGKGHFYKGEILLANDKKTEVKILETSSVLQPASRLHLYVALTKQADRLEWMLEKCVELGLASFTPLTTQRTERKHIRVDRLELIALSAMKQSLKVWTTRINPPLSFKHAIEQDQSETKLIAYCNDDDIRHSITDIVLGETCSVFIGPEGDFSGEEVDFALKKGFEGIELGPSRLRTETAGLAACNWMYWYNIKTQQG